MGARENQKLAARGVLWAVIYNAIWGIAWFAFMRNEWQAAMASINRPQPFTREVWIIWAVLTLPIGIALMAFAMGRQRVIQSALAATAIVWVILSLGLAISGVNEGVPARVLILDSVLNLIALAAASTVASRGAI